jgi:2-keto-3-deoxy-L-fuconate dehydrogenase
MTELAGFTALVTGGASGIGPAVVNRLATAGAAQGGIDANDDAEWYRVLDLNVVALVRACRAALLLIKRASHASIMIRLTARANGPSS